MRTVVHKFGGTSVGCAERIRAVAALVDEAAGREAVVVIASAMSGVTDQLLAAARAAATGADEDVVDAIEADHLEALLEIDPEATPERDAIRRIAHEVRALLRSVAVIGELTPRVHDRIVASGEKLSVRLVAAAIQARGRPARALDADTFLETDDRFGEASPLGSVAERTIVGRLGPLLDAGVVPVVTGFCGRAPDGATTTLGRGGSDLSATVVAAALGADEVVLWTDVPGVYTADPRVVPDAVVVDQLNYREAGELSYYGAKVLHQRTMIPVAARGIPVWTRSSFEPTRRGTVVDSAYTPGSHPVKAISAIRGQALLSLEGKGMAGVPGVAARLFSALAAHRISVTMISQSSSESSICLALPAADLAAAERAVKDAFRRDLSRGDVEEIVVQRGVGLVACVGLGMAHVPGIAARVFGALGRERINVLAIAQGSSELNISLAVEEDQVPQAIRALHHAFGLHQLDTGVDAARGLDLVLLGCGAVGRALCRLIADPSSGGEAPSGPSPGLRWSERIEARFGRVPRVVGIADRSGYVLRPAGIAQDELQALLAAKAAGRSLVSVGGTASADPVELVREAARWRLVRPILVDVTDADHGALEAALTAGFDAVTANKKPLAGPYAAYGALRSAVATQGRLLKAEATVGAGLPVIDTLEMLLATGDQLRRAEGCFSGTLGFVVSRMRDGERFSAAVREAVALGYTEPDPVADLSGADVARKALILGRWSGLVDGDVDVALEGFVDPGWAGLPRDVLLDRLATLDDAFARRVSEATARGEVLQFVATVTEGRVEVGPRTVPASSPIGALRGSDNLVVFTSDRYADRPLVVQGPGAGIEVTAMGVLSDVLRIAAERR